MKKFYILLILIFVYSCGYTSLYKEMQEDLNINILNVKGDFELNNFIKNDLKIASNKNSTNIYKINFETEFKKIILAKDATGNATDYSLDMTVKFIITSKNNQEIVYKENFKIKKNDDNFAQSNYEKEIKRNFSKSIREKLILELIKINDN